MSYSSLVFQARELLFGNMPKKVYIQRKYAEIGVVRYNNLTADKLSCSNELPWNIPW